MAEKEKGTKKDKPSKPMEVTPIDPVTLVCGPPEPVKDDKK